MEVSTRVERLQTSSNASEEGQLYPSAPLAPHLSCTLLGPAKTRTVRRRQSQRQLWLEADPLLLATRRHLYKST